MTPEQFPEESTALCETGRLFGQRGWCRATGGNFSLRVDNTSCLITQSGRDKSQLLSSDLMLCDLEGSALDSRLKSSAETLLHTQLYKLDKSINAVLHTHSVNATLLSHHNDADLLICGFEMQKALAGIESHDDEVTLAIFDNNQDIQALADTVADAWNRDAITAPGFLIRGHGLYAWGRDIAEAHRHVEGFEFLLECKWQESLAGLS